MIAVVLVGGEGTRLRPLTLDRPKPVLPIGGVPFASLMLDRLAAAGVERVVLSCGYLPEVLRAELGAVPAGLEVEVVVEEEPLGTAGAIRFAAEGRVDGPFLALNGDVLADADLAALIRVREESGARGAIGLTPVDDPTRFGVVVHDERGRVERFVEKPPSADGLGPAPWWVNAGAYALDPSVLDLIPADRPVSIEREVFPQLVEPGLVAVRDTGYWRDIGTLEGYLSANADAVAGRVRTRLAGSEVGPIVDPSARVDASARIGAPALIGPGAEVGPGAVVEGGAVVGAGCSVARDAVVDGSVLMDGASVGVAARVDRSVLGREAAVGDRARAVGCIVGTGEVVPAGAELLGERLPG